MSHKKKGSINGFKGVGKTSEKILAQKVLEGTKECRKEADKK